MSASVQPPIAASLFIKDPSVLDDEAIEQIVHWLRYEAVRLTRGEHEREEGDYVVDITLDADICPMN